MWNTILNEFIFLLLIAPWILGIYLISNSDGDTTLSFIIFTIIYIVIWIVFRFIGMLLLVNFYYIDSCFRTWYEFKTKVYFNKESWMCNGIETISGFFGVSISTLFGFWLSLKLGINFWNWDVSGAVIVILFYYLIFLGLLMTLIDKIDSLFFKLIYPKLQKNIQPFKELKENESFGEFWYYFMERREGIFSDNF